MPDTSTSPELTSSPQGEAPPQDALEMWRAVILQLDAHRLECELGAALDEESARQDG